LYTCIQQSEQKISLLESILLDLKMSAEMKSYTELPADQTPLLTKSVSVMQEAAYVPFDEVDEVDEVDEKEHVVDIDILSRTSTPKKGNVEEDRTEEEIYSSIVAEAVTDTAQDSTPKVNYETMSLKELQSLAMSRGITGAKSMKKGPLQEALRTSDRVRPGSDVVAGSSSFVETSASVSDESA
jgi:hypothetical protein